MKMNIENIDNHLKKLIGFESLGFYERKKFATSHYLIKSSHEAIFQLSYRYDQKGDQSLDLFGAFFYDIIFPAVNQILKTVLTEDNYKDNFNSLITVDLFETTVIEDSDTYSLRRSLERKANLMPIVDGGIYYEDRLIETCKFHKALLDQFAFPFFEKYGSLKSVNELIDSTPQMKIGSRILGEMPLKKLIIMFLNNNTKYQEYKEWLLDTSEKTSEKDDFYKLTKNLTEYLESNRYTDIHLDMIDVPTELSKSAEIYIHSTPLLEPNPKLTEAFTKQTAILAGIGIVLNDQFTLTNYRQDANWKSWGMDNEDGAGLLYHLLLFAGTQVHNPLTNSYDAVSNHAYYFNAEWDGFVDYGEILERLNLLTGNALPFREITGRFDDEMTGVTFYYKDVLFTWKMEYKDDWTDEAIFERFIGLVNSDLTKEFYILREGQGGVILYLSDLEKRAFENIFPTRALELLGVEL
ncbi:hypothetical protein [Chryseolinea lacunae]|uniref:Uncharacterized protein n=1 Tax=Chryseolinea lacunae TaxID=2801331 RepID=A0ABS1KJM7_9BACT|nr:hypothetical protein [Chryseolinea lacunae]MBL0739664.1 hypothetical protein [Chryseolinea lacunae]